ncbi:hypothetical protein Leryth_017314 [Lithospermum erythrorhizon]|nr:hypothetical protein Leryth_017314 [Lithospermum erythrorhizon]
MLKNQPVGKTLVRISWPQSPHDLKGLQRQTPLIFFSAPLRLMEHRVRWRDGKLLAVKSLESSLHIKQGLGY